MSETRRFHSPAEDANPQANLRTDPFEYADVASNTYYEWFIRHCYIMYAATDIAGRWAATFKDFPPIQKPDTFTLDDALKALTAGTGD